MQVLIIALIGAALPATISAAPQATSICLEPCLGRAPAVYRRVTLAPPTLPLAPPATSVISPTTRELPASATSGRSPIKDQRLHAPTCGLSGCATIQSTKLLLFNMQEVTRGEGRPPERKTGRRVPDPSHQDFTRPPAYPFLCVATLPDRAASCPRPASFCARGQDESSRATGPSSTPSCLARTAPPSARASKPPFFPLQARAVALWSPGERSNTPTFGETGATSLILSPLLHVETFICALAVVVSLDSHTVTALLALSVFIAMASL
ncbi:uncharacterized protein [Dermacentor albipictus]|uniref:uncharacterized protein n=1 Tax=Dermacentor albipictus TaxID=60249 RepID=UPI0038FC7ACA